VQFITLSQKHQNVNVENKKALLKLKVPLEIII